MTFLMRNVNTVLIYLQHIANIRERSYTIKHLSTWDSLISSNLETKELLCEKNIEIYELTGNSISKMRVLSVIIMKIFSHGEIKIHF